MYTLCKAITITIEQALGKKNYNIRSTHLVKDLENKYNFMLQALKKKLLMPSIQKVQSIIFECEAECQQYFV